MVSRTRKNNKRRSRRVQRGGKFADGVKIPTHFPDDLFIILKNAPETYDQNYINETLRNLGRAELTEGEEDQFFRAAESKFKTLEGEQIRNLGRAELTEGEEDQFSRAAESKFKTLEGEQKFKRLVLDTVEPYKDWVGKSCDVQLTKMREMGKKSFEKLIKDLEKIKTYLRNRKGDVSAVVNTYITRTINKLSIMKYREGDDKKFWWQKKGFFDNHYEMEPYECKMLEEGLKLLSLIPQKIATLYKTRVDTGADADEILKEISDSEAILEKHREEENNIITDRYNDLVKKISGDQNTGGAKKSRKRRKTTRRKTTRNTKRTNRRKLKSKKR